jgi:hypothetical protein
MGFAVDEQLEGLGLMSDEVSADFDWDAGFASIVAAVRRGGPAAGFAHKQADFWHSVTRSLTDGAAALIVTHGGFIELGTAACVPDADFDSLGGFCSQSEGVRLKFDNGQFIDVDVLRVG